MPRIKILVNMMRMLHSKYFILAVFIISKKTEQHLEWSKCENVVFSFWYPLPKHKAYTNFTNNLLCNQFLRKEKISNIYLQYAVFLVKIYYHNYTIRYLIFRFEVLWVFLYFVILIFNVKYEIKYIQSRYDLTFSVYKKCSSHLVLIISKGKVESLNNPLICSTYIKVK